MENVIETNQEFDGTWGTKCCQKRDCCPHCENCYPED